MTESEWLTATDPTPMLECVRGKFSERKSRLLACACCRETLATEERVAPSLRQLFVQPHDPEHYQAEIAFFRRAFTLSEQRADGVVNEAEYEELLNQFLRHPVTGCPGGYDMCAATRPDLAPVAIFEFIALTAFSAFQVPVDATGAAYNSDLAAAALGFLSLGCDEATRLLDIHRQSILDPTGAFRSAFRFQVNQGGTLVWVDDEQVEEANGYAVLVFMMEARRKTRGLVEDVFGNPFRPVALDPAWLTSTVVALALGIYDERAFDRMPILADALQDAGCDSADILNHCREPGEHVRGCWVVDLLLGKQ